jgi:hypothetical protein
MIYLCSKSDTPKTISRMQARMPTAQTANALISTKVTLPPD